MIANVVTVKPDMPRVSANMHDEPNELSGLENSDGLGHDEVKSVMVSADGRTNEVGK